MNANARTMQTEETKISVRFKLSALWIAMMLLYIYADIFSLYKPGAIENMMAGRMGPFPVTQASLLSAAVLTLIPAVLDSFSAMGASVQARYDQLAAQLSAFPEETASRESRSERIASD